MQDNIKKYPYKFCVIRDRGGDLKKRWYVEYYVWDENKDSLVRKVDYSINRFATVKERMSRAKYLKREIDFKLAQGKCIRLTDDPTPAERKAGPPPKQDITLESTFPAAVDFCIKVKTASLSKRSGTTYRSISNILHAWIKKAGYLELTLGEVDNAVMHEFFDDLKLVRMVDNITHNNYLVYLKSIFNFYIKRKVLTENPCSSIDKLPEQAKAHTPYQDEEREKVKDFLATRDPQLLQFCTFMYYTFIRRSELRLLQVGNIQGNKLVVPAWVMVGSTRERVSKNGKSESVVIPDGLKKLIEEMGLPDLPAHYFIFGHNGQPGPIPHGISYFSNKHIKYLKEIGISKGHTLYSWKHTGVIKLYQQIKDLKKIKEQCRHSDISITEKYLRDLGLFENYEVEAYFPEF